MDRSEDHYLLDECQDEEAEEEEAKAIEYVPPSWETNENMSQEQCEELFDNSDESFEEF